MLNVAPIRFAFIIVMLKRFRLLKKKLSEKNWWQKINYILAFTNSIYDVLRSTDRDAPTLHLVHEIIIDIN
ncbi:hypothetical protein S83_005317, partial [Arachis hypogaea]